MNNMEAGEKEMRMAFEEVTTKNVKATIDYSNETRKMVRTIEEKVKLLEDMMQSQNKTISDLRQQLAIVQGKLYQGGS
jgi:hypothetical protein